MVTQLEVSDLRKTFDDGSVVAVDNLNFTIEQGEIVTLLGPSGCGKTTTLRCIAGVEGIDSGSITLANETVASETRSLSPDKRGLGMVYQNYAIWPHKTVYENVVFPLENATHDVPRDRWEEKVMETLELVEIPHLSDSPATDLSGGQQQRVALARAIVHDPDLLLLDEPLSNLDAKLRASMRNEIQRLQHELGLTILYVTHDQEEAFYLADEVILLRDGELVESGRPDDLYVSPEHPFTRKFVGRWNQLDARLENGVVSSVLGEFDIEDTDDVHLNGSEAGQQVWCFIRPTNVELGEATTEGNTLNAEGTIISEGLLGELYELTVATEQGVDLTSQTSDTVEQGRGDSIRLTIDTSNIQIYPQEEKAQLEMIQ